jgi:hypothetical protein
MFKRLDLDLAKTTRRTINKWVSNILLLTAINNRRSTEEFTGISY